MAKSTTFKSDGKANKPYPGFPLFVHRNGQRAKKVSGELVYLGTALADRNSAAAVAKRLEQ